MRILVVEDEPDLANALARSLEDEEFAVDISRDGEDGLHRGAEVDYDAIVLDLLLPRLSGWDVLAALRARGRTTPILVLSALDQVDDRLRGLNGGADDYLTKPFVVAELVARLKALIRRAARHPSPTLVIGDIAIDLVAHRVFRGATEIELTAREFGILRLLARQRGTVVPRTAISDHLYSDESELMSNAIDVHVSALRKKLGPEIIQTRRGLGYLIDAAPGGRDHAAPGGRDDD
jgi:two-component system OmpR family response regulator